MIFYFSFTGNTLWAAKYMAEITNDKLVNIVDAFINNQFEYHIQEGERVGFLFPVHGWRLQPILKNFICNLKLNTEKLNSLYIYSVLTAGDSIGEVADQLEEALNDKGLKLSSICTLIMPESYIGLPFMDVDTDLREAIKKRDAMIMLRKYTEKIEERRCVKFKLNKGYFPRFYSRVLGKFFHKYLVKDNAFSVDTELCVGCGKCANVCQVNNIEIFNNSEGHLVPKWKHNDLCLTCFACYHYCPKKAISFRFTKNKGQYYYTHNK